MHGLSVVCTIDSGIVSARQVLLNSFWTHSMDLLCDIGHVESHFNPFGDSGIVSAR
jgi:hypothetical protein